MIIDAWAQHPTTRHSSDPIFDSLRRWARADPGSSLERASEMSLRETVAAMDEGGVDISLISAWVGPKGVMISNDEVAAFVSEAPGRLIGVGSVDISRPMQAVREIRRCVPRSASEQTDVRKRLQLPRWPRHRRRRPPGWARSVPRSTPAPECREMHCARNPHRAQQARAAGCVQKNHLAERHAASQDLTRSPRQILTIGSLRRPAVPGETKSTDNYA